MAETISQKLEFNAAQAIQSLAKLQKSLSGVNRELVNLKRASGGNFDPAAQSIDKLKSNAMAAEARVRKLGTTMRTTGTQGTAAARSITVSWETMARVIITQGIVRGLNAIVNAAQEAAEQVHDLQIETARMSQIAAGPGSSIGDLTESIVKLSAELGRPISEVSEAAMEALQNDLGTTAETMDLLSGAAGDLALVTGSDLTSSVNSLSSVLKSYNLDASKAADIADTFFVAIDRGRVKLSELESRLGTVLPLSATLGVEFHEASAAVASLTLSGLNSSTAMTQLRNILAKLVKPTDLLKGAFERLGVTSGSELVRKFGGLQGALAALKAAFNGNEQEVAKAFGTIRGQVGVLNLLADEGTNFTKVLEAMENRAGRAAEAAEAIDNVTARQIDKEFQKFNQTLLKMGRILENNKLAALSLANIVLGNNDQFGDIASAREQEIKNAVKNVQTQLDQGVAADRQRGQFERDTVPLTGDAKAAFDEISRIGEEVAIEQRKINAAIQATEGLIQANINAQAKFAEVARDAATVADLGVKGRVESREETRAASEDLAQLSQKIQAANAQQLGQLEQELHLIDQKTAERVKDGQLSEEAVRALEGQLHAVQAQIEAYRKIHKLKSDQAEFSAGAIEVEETLIRLLEDATKAMQGQAQATGDSISGIQGPINSIDTGPAVAQMARLEAAAHSALAAAQAAASTGGTPAFHGRHFADGGGVRGADTIPAMLSPGEFVVNSRSARKFFPQIQAMNAGQQPAFRDEGGSVTNIGDIHFTNHFQKGDERSAREIANQLRREIRRGTTRL